MLFRPEGSGRGAEPQPVLLSWSGGKDSVLALQRLRRTPGLEPAGLVTAFTEPGGRVATHRVRRELVEAQAAALGLPLHPVALPPDPADRIYEERLAAVLAPLAARGIRRIAFGDLFLADLRAYRERHLAALGMTPVFPLWGRDTAALARRFLAAGFAATLVCVDTAVLPASFAGRPYDAALLADLPPGVDPCGENGEFHTFVHGGPLFARPLPVAAGARETAGRFSYADLLPGPA
jgi:uncharacterized protein (TIGR00290 family)